MKPSNRFLTTFLAGTLAMCWAPRVSLAQEADRELKVERRVRVVFSGSEGGDQTHEERKVIVIDGKGEGPVILPTMFRHRAFLGIQLVDITPDLRAYFGVPEDVGVLISAVSDDSPAQIAGLRAGDVLTSIDGKAVSQSGAVMREVGRHEENDTVSLETWRDGKILVVTATLTQRERSQLDLGNIFWHQKTDAGTSYSLLEGQHGLESLKSLESLPESVIEIESGAFDEALSRLHERLESGEWRQNIDEMMVRRQGLEERISELEEKLREMEQRLSQIPE